MTDLEITKLCAEAMGYVVGVSTPAGLVWIGDNAFPHLVYDPIHDDAQAMALVKKFDITIGRGTNYFVVEHAHYLPGGEIYETQYRPKEIIRSSSQSLNRAICECVAKMQKEKSV